MTDTFIVLQIHHGLLGETQFFLWRYNNFNHLIFGDSQYSIKGFSYRQDSEIKPIPSRSDPRILQGRYLHFVDRDDKTISVIGPVEEIMVITDPHEAKRLRSYDLAR